MSITLGQAIVAIIILFVIYLATDKNLFATIAGTLATLSFIPLNMWLGFPLALIIWLIIVTISPFVILAILLPKDKKSKVKDPRKPKN